MREEGGSSKNCMRQRAASNSYDYHNLYGLGDLRQAAAAAASAALGRARNQNQNKSKGIRNREQKTETERAAAKDRARESRRNLLLCCW